MLGEIDYALDCFRTNAYDCIQALQQNIFYWKGGSNAQSGTPDGEHV